MKKYDGFGPRYTSYPTADRFHDGVHGRALRQRAARAQPRRGRRQPLSLYVHVPFCNTICYYCACNKVITKDHGRSAKYIQLRRTRDRASSAAWSKAAPPVEQLHWGGGTPTFLVARRDGDADGHAARRASRSRRTPRSRSRSIRARSTPTRSPSSAELGFNRISVGIQDFDPAVQKAVNRIQSEAETRTVIDAARANGFVSVNADLIYGLPQQTVAGFSATLDKVIAASPDRIALYSYAHVPHLFKPQRRIDDRRSCRRPRPSSRSWRSPSRSSARPATSTSAWTISPSPATSSPSRSASASCTAISRAIRRKPDCDLLAFGISAIGKVGPAYVAEREDARRVLRRGSTPARCRCCAASS